MPFCSFPPPSYCSLLFSCIHTFLTIKTKNDCLRMLLSYLTGNNTDLLLYLYITTATYSPYLNSFEAWMNVKRTFPTPYYTQFMRKLLLPLLAKKNFFLFKNTSSSTANSYRTQMDYKFITLLRLIINIVWNGTI